MARSRRTRTVGAPSFPALATTQKTGARQHSRGRFHLFAPRSRGDHSKAGVSKEEGNAVPTAILGGVAAHGRASEGGRQIRHYSRSQWRQSLSKTAAHSIHGTSASRSP